MVLEMLYVPAYVTASFTTIISNALVVAIVVTTLMWKHRQGNCVGFKVRPTNKSIVTIQQIFLLRRSTSTEIQQRSYNFSYCYGITEFTLLVASRQVFWPNGFRQSFQTDYDSGLRCYFSWPLLVVYMDKGKRAKSAITWLPEGKGVGEKPVCQWYG